MVSVVVSVLVVERAEVVVVGQANGLIVLGRRGVFLRLRSYGRV